MAFCQLDPCPGRLFETVFPYQHVGIRLAQLLHSQIQLHRSSEGVEFYTLVLDDQECKRRLAVKRMPWEVINDKLEKVTEVGKLGCA